MILSPLPVQKFFSNNGEPLVGGLLFTYSAGTTTPIATYTDASGGTPNTNPIVLDFRGECRVWLDQNASYKFILSPPGDTDPPTKAIWTVDNISPSSILAFGNYSVDTGITNVYVAASAIPVAAYVPGLLVSVKISNANTGASTLAYAGLAAKAITLQNGAALAGGEIIAGGIYQFEYDGTNFQLLDPAVAYWRTAAEIAAGVTPVNYAYPTFYVARYGAVGNGATDDTVAIQAACDAAEAAGGGEVFLNYGADHKLTAEITVGEKVSLNMNRATTNHYFVNGSADVAYDLKDFSAIYNGSVNVIGTGSPALTREAWQCVNIGRTGASLGGFTGCRVSDLTTASNRNDVVGGVGVLIQAGCSNIIVENIYIPSSATIGSGVRIAWAGPGGSPPATSEHPHDILVQNITFGTMTKTGSTFDLAGIDIVGAYNIIVQNVSCDRWAGDAFVQVRVGGFGSTVAPANIAPLLFKNIIVQNVTGKQIDGCIVIVNGQANDAVGTPDNSVPAIFENIKSIGINSPSGGTGVHVLNAFDTIFQNCDIQRHKSGFYIEEGAKRIQMSDCRATLNQEAGFFIGHSTAPEDVILERCEAYLNGQDNNTHAGFEAESATRTVFEDCKSGDTTSETTQIIGFRVSTSAVDTQFRGRNTVRNIKAGGIRYSISVPVLGDLHFAGGSGLALSTTAAEYAPLSGLGLSATEADVSIPIIANVVLTNFVCRLTVAPGGGKSRRFRIVDDGAATASDITISDAATSGTYYPATEVSAASLMDVISTSTGTPAASRVTWVCEGFRT